MDHVSPTPKALRLLGGPHGTGVGTESPLVSLDGFVTEEIPSRSAPLGDSSQPGAGTDIGVPLCGRPLRP